MISKQKLPSPPPPAALPCCGCCCCEYNAERGVSLSLCGEFVKQTLCTCDEQTCDCLTFHVQEPDRPHIHHYLCGCYIRNHSTNTHTCCCCIPLCCLRSDALTHSFAALPQSQSHSHATPPGGAVVVVATTAAPRVLHIELGGPHWPPSEQLMEV